MDTLKVHTLQAGNVRADITALGARIMRLTIGGTDVVLGFDHAADYMPEWHLSDFGAVIGRYANRLAKGRIALDWDILQLPRNDGPNCLHGGPRGWQYSLYDIRSASASRLELAMVSPDGDQGFPGTVQVRVVYTLDSDGSLRVDYRAETDRPTVINMTNHSYFNLDGAVPAEDKTLGTVHNHLLQIDADRYTPVNKVSIPLGKHDSVEGTPFDFRQAKPIGRDIDADNAQLHIGHGYDHNYVLNRPSLQTPSATLASTVTGITLQIFTTAPGMQLYTGNYLDGVAGKAGIRYPARSAVCLETQQYPDSPNRSWPESTGRLYPDSPFESTTVYKLTQQ